ARTAVRRGGEGAPGRPRRAPGRGRGRGARADAGGADRGSGGPVRSRAARRASAGAASGGASRAGRRLGARRAARTARRDVTLFLVRHASAGHRASWEGEQRIRPLDERGRRQALALVDLLEGEPIERILSSPAFRCVQTVEPLAAARGLEIELRDELTEERQADDGAAL